MEDPRRHEELRQIAKQEGLTLIKHEEGFYWLWPDACSVEKGEPCPRWGWPTRHANLQEVAGKLTGKLEAEREQALQEAHEKDLQEAQEEGPPGGPGGG
jgi:hypothetical protein